VLADVNTDVPPDDDDHVETDDADIDAEAYQGAPGDDAGDEANQGAPGDAHVEAAEAGRGAPADDRPARPYNLRDRTPRTTIFRNAIDQPHSAKSYYPPRQLVQAHQLQQIHQMKKLGSLHDKCKFAMDFVLAHISAKMKTDAGIKKTQMSFKEGLRRYGRATEAALMAEFAQLESLDVYEAVNARFLTRAQRRAALRAINLIKEKRCGTIKGRTVADGRPQRTLYDKLETASPTIATDALILSIIIEAYEGRDVATADIAGAYLKALMKDFVLMRLSGETVRILCEMNPKHKPFVVSKNGERVLYVGLLKALYGCVKSALLWYELFSSTLQEMGFTL
jgi:hypothetical protein